MKPGLRSLKITKATLKHKRHHSHGKQSGGDTFVVIFDRAQDPSGFFGSKIKWSVAIQTDWGIIPTLFSVKPKEQNRNQHTRIHKEKLEIHPKHIQPTICPNFERKNSIFDVVRHYCSDWKIAENISKNIVEEAETSFLMLEDRYSKRGLLVLINPEKNQPLKRLGINSSIVNDALLNSVLYHLAKLQLIENAKEFVTSWRNYNTASSEESYLAQKRDDLGRIGFQCCFRRIKGVDSPASLVCVMSEKGKIQFNIDIELKDNAQLFFKDNEAGNIQKYPRLPMLILANTDSSKEPEIQQILHPTMSIETLLDRVLDRLIDTLPMMSTTQQEIERLNQIIFEESQDVNKFGASVPTRKKRKIG